MKINKWVALLVLVLLIIACSWIITDELFDVGTTDNAPVHLFGIDQGRIKDILVSSNNDTFELTLDNGVWYFKDDPEIRVMQIRASGLAYDMSSIVAERLVEKNAVNLSKYGLEPAVSTVMARLTDNTEHIFYVGNRIPESTEYYFKTGNDNNVYTVYIGKGQMFTSKRDDFKDKNLSFANWNEIDFIRVSSNGEKVLELKKGSEQADGPGWRLCYPIDHNANTGLVQSEILSRIIGMTAISYVPDSNFEALGLQESSTRVEILKTDGTSFGYLIGNTNDEGNCYVLADGVKEPAEVDGNVALLSKVTAYTVCDTTIYAPDIVTVSSVRVLKDGKDNEISVKKDGDRAKYYAGKKLISEAQYETIYDHIVSLKADGICQTIPQKRVDKNIRFTFTDRSAKQLNFYEYDEENYAISADGKCYFLLQKENVNKWTEKLNELL